MPTAALKPCGPNCGVLVPDGHCPAHTAYKALQPRKIEERKIYKTKRWQILRAQVMREQPFCPCGRVGTECDHIIPHRNDETLKWSRTNVQMLCHDCHFKKTMSGQ